MQTHEAPSAEERAAAIGENIARLQERMAEIAGDAGRDPQSVHLRGATKGVEPERVIAAIRHGLTHFGENWVQEAAPKITEVNVLAEEQGIVTPTWHMIGHLQRNKARQALHVFQAIDTVDSLRLAETISRRAEQLNVGPVEALIEIDFTNTPQREGFKLPLEKESETVAAFLEDARRIIELPNLNVIGLMTVGPMAGENEAARPAFRRLREIRDELSNSIPGGDFPHLSMGMSGDYEAAIQEGSTIVRLGTAIFGPRPTGRTY